MSNWEKYEKYALELLVGFALFPVLILLISVIAAFAAVFATLSHNPAIATTILLVGAGLTSWLVIKILRRASDLIWQG
jgi:threonine/homoserine/homoserine lactone efflux protein